MANEKGTSETRLMKGNEALAEAAFRAGMQAYFGYPITPQSEVLEYLAAQAPNRMLHRMAHNNYKKVN